MQSSASKNPISGALPVLEPRPLTLSPDLRGKHRRQAESSRLDVLISDLEDELEKLNTIPKVSDICTEFIGSVINREDPFLPETRGEGNPQKKWLEGHRKRKGCCCCCYL